MVASGAINVPPAPFKVKPELGVGVDMLVVGIGVVVVVGWVVDWVAVEEVVVVTEGLVLVIVVVVEVVFEVQAASTKLRINTNDTAIANSPPFFFNIVLLSILILSLVLLHPHVKG